MKIGIDSLVFLDDNPFEREQVRRELPLVAVPELPQEPALYPRVLGWAGYFEAVAISAEDRKRADFYQANATRAAALSGTLALPPGILGMLTVLPDLVAIWRIQAQLVADIAGLYGRNMQLTRTHMLYCLFRHATSHVARDVAVRAGQRLVVQRAPGWTAKIGRGSESNRVAAQFWSAAEVATNAC